MTRPGFRKGSTGGSGRFGTSPPGSASGGPFSQAQILHLMKIEFARARRHGFPIACVLLQVDRWNQLIDLYGAELRTEVRQALHRLVQDKTRGSDYLGLVNDDRFLMLLPHTGLEPALRVAERIQTAFRDLEVTVDGKALALTLSIGVTASADQDTLFFETLLEQAEVALADATRQGGDRVLPFSRANSLRPGSGSGPDKPREDEP